MNVPDGTRIRLLVDDEPLECTNTEVLEFERVLDMEHAALERRVVYRAPGGKRFQVTSTRFVSLAHRHLACIRYEVTALDEPATLTLSSELVTHYRSEATLDDPRRGLGMARGVYENLFGQAEGARALLAMRTAGSRLTVACGMHHEAQGDDVQHAGTSVGEDYARSLFRIEAEVGRPAVLTKWVAYHHGAVGPGRPGVPDQDHAGSGSGPGVRGGGSPPPRGGRGVLAARRHPLGGCATAAAGRPRPACSRSSRPPGGSRVLGSPQRVSADWAMRVTTSGTPRSTSCRCSCTPCPRWRAACCCSDTGCWSAARVRAQEVGHRGALFPWRTISGDEASSNWAAGTAQYHINADIAYAVWQYVRVTGDMEFLHRYGSEILVETARLWFDLGFFSPRVDGEFVINGVTGPDEYTTVVDNNLYTNLMAAENMRLAAEAVELTKEAGSDHFRRLLAATGLTPDEPANWLLAPPSGCTSRSTRRRTCTCRTTRS